MLSYNWEAQPKCLDFPKSGLVVTTDLVDDLGIIHLGYKWEVSRRLSLWTFANDYGKKRVYSGPLYRNMKMSSNNIELSFTQTGSGLISDYWQAISWFNIAEIDHKFLLAQAIIKGNKVIVSSTVGCRTLCMGRNCDA